MTGRIKICGLTCAEDIDLVNEAIPDYIGFVFAQSRRQVSPKSARALRQKLDPQIPAAGVFVNHDPEEIIRLYEDHTIQLVQLHGQEDFQTIQYLKSRLSCPIIKAVCVNGPEDIRSACQLPADFLLLDHGRGGTGQSFDWRMIPDISKPFFLAGGLNITNIQNARSYGSYCLDVSSGAETGGKKDRDKIHRLIAAVHSKELSRLPTSQDNPLQKNEIANNTSAAKY